MKINIHTHYIVLKKEKKENPRSIGRVRCTQTFSHRHHTNGKTGYCKSRIFRMHFIFVYFVRSGFRTKIKCIPKIQSKSQNQQPSAAVRKFHAYERSGVPRIRKFSAYEIFWIYSIRDKCVALPFHDRGQPSNSQWCKYMAASHGPYIVIIKKTSFFLHL